MNYPFKVLFAWAKIPVGNWPPSIGLVRPHERQMLALLGGFWPCSHSTLRYFIGQGRKIAPQTFSRGHHRRCLEREGEMSQWGSVTRDFYYEKDSYIDTGLWTYMHTFPYLFCASWTPVNTDMLVIDHVLCNVVPVLMSFLSKFDI